MELIHDEHDEVIPAMPEALDDHNSVDAINGTVREQQDHTRLTPDLPGDQVQNRFSTGQSGSSACRQPPLESIPSGGARHD